MGPAPEDAWDAWHPVQLADRLRPSPAIWYIVGGWALDLWHGHGTRPHGDLDCAAIATDLPGLLDRLNDLTFFAARDGRLTPLPPGPLPPKARQFWGLDPASRVWRVDMMPEPGTRSHWTYKRDATIRLPRAKIVHRTDGGIPYLAPEAVLLFKAKHRRDKDEGDFEAALPKLSIERRRLLASWLDIAHPGHDWSTRLR
ncbi:MAG: amino acid transporter [Pseudomonadota bacterium]